MLLPPSLKVTVPVGPDEGEMFAVNRSLDPVARVVEAALNVIVVLIPDAVTVTADEVLLL
jgi:hypothetical protein